jgi:hypothetical protein
MISAVPSRIFMLVKFIMQIVACVATPAIRPAPPLSLDPCRTGCRHGIPFYRGLDISVRGQTLLSPTKFLYTLDLAMGTLVSTLDSEVYPIHAFV